MTNNLNNINLSVLSAWVVIVILYTIINNKFIQNSFHSNIIYNTINDITLSLLLLFSLIIMLYGTIIIFGVIFSILVYIYFEYID